MDVSKHLTRCPVDLADDGLDATWKRVTESPASPAPSTAEQAVFTISEIEQAFDCYAKRVKMGKDTAAEVWHDIAMQLTTDKIEKSSCVQCESRAVSGQCFSCDGKSNFK